MDERALYDPIIPQVVWGLRHIRLYLTLDRTLVGEHFNVLMVSVSIRKRALPLAWTLPPPSSLP